MDYLIREGHRVYARAIFAEANLRAREFEIVIDGEVVGKVERVDRPIHSRNESLIGRWAAAFKSPGYPGWDWISYPKDERWEREKAGLPPLAHRTFDSPGDAYCHFLDEMVRRQEQEIAKERRREWLASGNLPVGREWDSLRGVLVYVRKDAA